MNSKNVKVVDEHNIDRNANVMFAFDLEGSEYAVYWIERDGENNNIFVSKVIKNIDGTFNMLDIDDADEKVKIADIVKNLISTSVSDEADKLDKDSLILSDGKSVKFITVSFNKEQKINVQKTYITTVKKEVTKVAEKYYTVEIKVETPPVVENIFPSVFPVVGEEEKKVEQTIPQPVVETPVVAPVEPTPVVPSPAPEVPQAPVADSFVTFGTEEPKLEVPSVQPSDDVTPVVQPVPEVVESITTTTSEAVKPAEPVAPVIPTVEPVPEVSISAPATDASQPLIFNASKETNLNAALGEAAKDVAIPVENIEPVREFGVDEPVSAPTPAPVNVAPISQPVADGNTSSTASTVGTQPVSKKAGFANSKFFMVVAVAFFLASCVFLGYEVFNYFQLTK